MEDVGGGVILGVASSCRGRHCCHCDTGVTMVTGCHQQAEGLTPDG